MLTSRWHLVLVWCCVDECSAVTGHCASIGLSFAESGYHFHMQAPSHQEHLWQSRCVGLCYAGSIKSLVVLGSVEHPDIIVRNSVEGC